MGDKLYFVAKNRGGRTTVFTGTINDLVNEVFQYTLECGNRRNRRINRNPKTIDSLVNALNKSVYETQGCCHEQDYYFKTTFQEAEEKGWTIY